jgi:excisionase family DNA binding protein
MVLVFLILAGLSAMSPGRPGKLGAGWVTLLEAAEYLSVSDDTVRRYVSRGELPAYRLPGGRTLRIRVDDLEALATSQRVPVSVDVVAS